MILQDVAMLVSESDRTKLYIEQMGKHKLLPAYVIYMGNGKPTIPKLLEKYKIPYTHIRSTSPNSFAVVEAVAKCEQSVIIYSGQSSIILQKPLFDTSKKFLHIHSGIVPEYRGSTTIYYSLLKEHACGATALFLNEKIDMGDVIKKRLFDVPKDRSSIDTYYDSFIRSQLLIEVLKSYVAESNMPDSYNSNTYTYSFISKPQDKLAGETYYIIHPVLKHIAILGN